MHYTSYGLTIASALALPELPQDTTTPADSAPDVTIDFGAIDPAGLPNGNQLGPFLWVTDDALWLQVPEVARFQISLGKRITIDPAPGIDEDSLRVFLLGSALGALLFQRGYLVLHGNAIRIGGQCMICVGHSGAGKSTLAAGFLQRGYEILADDVVPVDDTGAALPGFPRIKLWQDTATRLGIETAGLRRIRPQTEKFNYPLHERFTDRPLPIRWVYILNKHHEPDIRLDAIRGLQRFTPLRNNTYRVRFMEGMPLKSHHLQRCGLLAGRIHLARVTRPDHGFELDTLIDRILADIAAHP